MDDFSRIAHGKMTFSQELAEIDRSSSESHDIELDFNDVFGDGYGSNPNGSCEYGNLYSVQESGMYAVITTNTEKNKFNIETPYETNRDFRFDTRTEDGKSAWVGQLYESESVVQTGSVKILRIC